MLSKKGMEPMGKRDDLIAKYADDLRKKCGIEPDMDLLTKVTIGCGPAIYDDDASTVAAVMPKRRTATSNARARSPHGPSRLCVKKRARSISELGARAENHARITRNSIFTPRHRF